MKSRNLPKKKKKKKISIITLTLPLDSKHSAAPMTSGCKRARFGRISCPATLKTLSGSELRVIIAGTPKQSVIIMGNYGAGSTSIRAGLHTFSHEINSAIWKTRLGKPHHQNHYQSYHSQ